MKKVITTNSVILFNELTTAIVSGMRVSLPINMPLIKELYSDKGILINSDQLLITIDFKDDVANDCRYYLDCMLNGQIDHIQSLELEENDKCFLSKLALQTLIKLNDK